MIELPVQKIRENEEEERCAKCGRLLFKVYKDKEFVFVEIKCGGCNNFVIKKFLAYVRK